ncbi:uncharacterized protein LOC131874967 [Cryptomeria japonica]|uniref:uncharacterized protein LOC131874967 n=1 Tax=Cryptomeria japonica TaxID=3369 RepID=UPI0027D9D4D2|nr:uncharacterized protein LOC131874967 [Cryptomeria japonica]
MAKSKGKKPQGEKDLESLEVALIKINPDKRNLETPKNSPVKTRKIKKYSTKKSITIHLDLQDSEKEEEWFNDKENKESISQERMPPRLLCNDKNVQIKPKVTTFDSAEYFNLKDDDDSSNEDTGDKEYQAKDVEKEDFYKEDMEVGSDS